MVGRLCSTAARVPCDTWLLHRLSHRVLRIHLNSAAEWIPLQYLLLLVVTLHGLHLDVLGYLQLLFLLNFGLIFLHLYLLLNARNLVSHAHRVRLHLLAHLERLTGRLGIPRLNHLADVNLRLRQVHQLEVRADLQLLIILIRRWNG